MKRKHCWFCKHFLLLSRNPERTSDDPWEMYDRIECMAYGRIEQDRARKCKDYNENS